MKFVTFLLICMPFFVIAASFDCESDGVKLKTGETHELKGQCAVLICEKTGNMRQQGCAIAALSLGCKIIPFDLSKPYPKCCESYVC